MPWPTPQEYNEAIQNPARCFADAELQKGAPELTALGLPRPVTGNFASVYRLHAGGRDWAVRCFFRAADDLAARYAAIGENLRRTHLPYTVSFAYLERGILVRGQWYPILKMEWVEGEMLGVWVERHLGDAKALRSLAERWRSMTHALENARVAHGDLQHGNVVVVGGQLKLVDYDGMYVPALTGRESQELGHPNYQHPGRDERCFGISLDRFSAWLIYGSLLALADAPDLWDGDECLILRGADLRDPARSATFTRLTRHPSDTARALSAQIDRLLSLDPNHLPPLTVLPPAPTWRTGPDWLEDHLPRRYAFAVGLRRRAAVGMTLLLFIALLAAGTSLAILGIVAVLCLPFALYASDPLVLARARLQLIAARRRLDLSLADRRHQSLQRRRAAVETRHDAALRQALHRKRAVQQSRIPSRYKSWRLTRLDSRIRGILSRHAELCATLNDRSAALTSREQSVSRSLRALHASLDAYEAIDLPHFLRALCALE